MKKFIIFLIGLVIISAGCLVDAGVHEPVDSGFSNPGAIVDVHWLSEHLNDASLRLIDLDASNYFE
jgi:hypothetical protein